jgi:hypothetical protein
VKEGFIFSEHRKGVVSDVNPETLLRLMEQYQHPHEAVKRWMKEE